MAITLGEYLIKLLERFDVEHVFGIPGVHTAELYRGLTNSPIRHVTPRHEQGASFAADGYARMSGKPGVCLLITGPGLTNAMTGIGQAYADSIPMLILSGVNATRELGHGRGRLHELPNQNALMSQITAFSHTLTHADDILPVLERAFAVFEGGRPRPVHIEIPLDLMGADASHLALPEQRSTPMRAPCIHPDQGSTFAEMCQAAQRPIILAGGGARGAAEELTRLAEALNAPVVTTTNARGLLGDEHPLALNASPSLYAVRALVEQADLTIAVGTELGQTDYDVYGSGPFQAGGKLVRIDIDPQQLKRNARAELEILSDARAALADVVARVPETGKANPLAEQVPGVRAAAAQGLSPLYARVARCLGTVWNTIPDAVFVGDSTQPVYAGNDLLPIPATGRWFNSATGFGTLGYALPAAIGAKAAAAERPVIAVAGDGGFQFTLTEMAMAAEADLPVSVIVWDNACYLEISNYMKEINVPPVAVDLVSPDFAAIATAYGWNVARVRSEQELIEAIALTQNSGTSTLILGMEFLDEDTGNQDG
ncbi:5-guanidino-2-oxopentanoate decarboxylase [Roseovarius sp. CAU 1744]|uniref:5-guanidino-2-oxopentanoate decarboxylase n=1 Tax=Roseovarius sp. CAU 1744 TaxID=3140368 RepID=UPI00325B38C6